MYGAYVWCVFKNVLCDRILLLSYFSTRSRHKRIISSVLERIISSPSFLQFTIARSIGEFQTTIIVYNLLTRTRNTKYTAFCNKHIVRHFQSPIHHYCIPRYATISYFPLVNCSEFSCFYHLVLP